MRAPQRENSALREDGVIKRRKKNAKIKEQKKP